MTERGFALFDIDNTVYNGYVIFDLAQAQVEEKLLSKEVLEQLNTDTDRYTRKIILYEEYADQAMKHWAEGLSGKTEDRISTHAQRFLRNNREKFFNYFEAVVKLLVDTHDLYLVTAEPKFVCQAISDIFPINGSAASEFYVNKGRFSGMAKVLATSQDKNSAIDSILADHISERSFAFGDASSDVDILERATYKICVDHPRSTLRDTALEKGKQKGWFVVQPENVIEQVSTLLLG